MSSQAHDDYWSYDEALAQGTFRYFRSKPRTIRALLHESPETYHFLKQEEREIIPVEAIRGERTYLQVQLYVPVPNMYLSVGLSAQPTADGALGEVIGTEQRGWRRQEIGKVQAWYYPADHLVVLFECFFDRGFRDAPLLEDANMYALWAGMEHWLVGHFPEAQRIVTPFGDPNFDRQEYQAFLRRLGFTPKSGSKTYQASENLGFYIVNMLTMWNQSRCFFFISHGANKNLHCTRKSAHDGRPASRTGHIPPIESASPSRMVRPVLFSQQVFLAWADFV